MKQNEAEIFQFMAHALQLANAPYNIINNELIMAQCQIQVPRSFFTPAHIENLNLQLVCVPELLKKYPGAELVTRGSFRLEWFIEGIRQRGQLTKATYPYELNPLRTSKEITALLDKPVDFYFERPNLTFQPHLFANFHLSFETDEKFEEMRCLSINLVSGEIASNLLNALIKKKLSPQIPKKNTTKKAFSYREGFEALWNHLQWNLKHHDPTWITEAQQRWEQELKYLEAYYQGNQTQIEQNNFYRQAAEIYQKYQPAIHVRLTNLALLYLPLITFTVEAHDSNTTLPLLIYDPVRQRISWEKTNSSVHFP